MLLAPMATNGVEATGAMGIDTPLAVLSDKPKLLYDYFKQLFAQVTNPPIDPIRESIITCAETTIGSEGNLLEPTPESCHLITLKTPIISNADLAKLRNLDSPLHPELKRQTNPEKEEHGFKAHTCSILFSPKSGVEGLEQTLNGIYDEADRAIKKGCTHIILSDRGVNSYNAPIPALLAVSGLHHHLIRNGTRTRIGIILESGEPKEVHHFAVLLGYGCGAINPYLAF